MRTPLLSALAVLAAVLALAYWSGWFDSSEARGRDRTLPNAADAAEEQARPRVELTRPTPSLEVVGLEETVPATEIEARVPIPPAATTANTRLGPPTALPRIPTAKETELSLLKQSLEDLFDDSEDLDRFTPWLEEHLQAEAAWAAGRSGAAAVESFNSALKERLDVLAETFEPELAEVIAERLSLHMAKEDGKLVRIDWRGRPVEGGADEEGE